MVGAADEREFVAAGDAFAPEHETHALADRVLRRARLSARGDHMEHVSGGSGIRWCRVAREQHDRHCDRDDEQLAGAHTSHGVVGW